jgi:hypothetical protein
MKLCIEWETHLGYNSSVMRVAKGWGFITMSYRGYVKNGTVVLDDSVVLPEGAPVQVDLVQEVGDDSAEENIPTIFERLKPVIGIAQGLPTDAAINTDHYLYGQPKR